MSTTTATRARGNIDRMPRRALIYARISNDRAGAGLGVQRQVEDCRALAARLGWEVVAVHEDNDISAMSRKPRPGYRAMLADLRDGTADALLAWHSDRLYRRLTELEELIDLLNGKEIALSTVTSGDLDLSSASGRRTARILASVSQGEVEQARERMVRAKLQAAEAGKVRGSIRPFGYESGGLKLRPSEAEPLAEATRAVADGASLATAWGILQARSPLSTTGKPHRRQGVRDLILRPRNAGFVMLRGEILPGAVGEWEPLIDEDTWRAARAILTDPARKSNLRGTAPRHLLTRTARCGICGAQVYVQGSAGGRKNYTCRASKRHISRTQEPLDNYIVAIVAGRLAMPDVADLLVPAHDIEAHTAARRHLDGLRAREAELADLFADGSISSAQLARASSGIADKITAAEADVDRLSARGDLGWLATAPDPVQAFRDAPQDQRRAVVDALLEVTIHKPAMRGRPAGVPKGGYWTDLSTIEVVWKS